LARVSQVEIDAKFEGYDPALFPDVRMDDVQKKLPKGVQANPRFTTKFGNRAVMEIIREFRYPIAPGKFDTANCGVTLEATPTMKDGVITLNGKTIIRQLVHPGGEQPLNAKSFVVRETHFTGAMESGKPLVISTGDGDKDKSQVTLLVRVLNSKPKAEK
jgi:hypothetical protein